MWKGYYNTGINFSDIPNAADSDDGGEAGGQFVAPQSCPCIHTGHNLYSFQTHPLKVVVIKPIVSDDL